MFQPILLTVVISRYFFLAFFWCSCYISSGCSSKVMGNRELGASRLREPQQRMRNMAQRLDEEYLQYLVFETSGNLNLNSKSELVTISAVNFPLASLSSCSGCKQEESKQCLRASFPPKHSSGNAYLSALKSKNNPFYVAVPHFLPKLVLLCNM